MKKALVAGAGGFIGSHMVNFLKEKGYEVTGVGQKYPSYENTKADLFILADLTDPSVYGQLFKREYDEVYTFAGRMGGMGFISKEHLASLHDSNLINTYMARACIRNEVYPKLFFSSSACVYPISKQTDIDSGLMNEEDAIPADPNEAYGWEKLMAEMRYKAYRDTYGLKIAIARFGNCYGPGAVYKGGAEKAPAALCRKVIMTKDGNQIEVWGDGLQRRSFMYIDDCVRGAYALMQSDYQDPVNIGSDEVVSINELAQMIIDLSGKKLTIKHIDGPQGIRSRNINHTKARNILGWEAEIKLKDGLKKTYEWINSQINS